MVFIRKFCSFLFTLLLPLASMAAAQRTVTYTVEKGDTLYAISRKYGVTVEQLREANGMASSSVIKVGQKLSIPQEDAASVGTERQYDVYTVQKGDTLYRIATVNGITVNELKVLNDLSDASLLRAGQKLKIPVTIVDTAHASLPDLPSSDPRKYESKKGNSNLAWPVEYPTVTYIKGKVSGVQLSAKPQEAVTSIRAGTVMYTGNYRGYGQVVFVQSKTGYIYAYTGLGSIKVKKGDYVVFGDTLGTAGTDSIKGTPQISLMVFYKSEPIDPAKAPRG